MNVHHSHDSPEWYTPDTIISRARLVMGGIDLDPASHVEANRVVKAKRFFTERDNGLTRRWWGKVFVNPPGGLVNEFWSKLMNELPDQWLWVGFSLEQLQSLQSAGAGDSMPHPFDFNYCIPARRIAYVENAAKRAARETKLREQGKTPNKSSSPSHGSYIVYDGPNVTEFIKQFSTLGYVRT